MYLQSYQVNFLHLDPVDWSMISIFEILFVETDFHRIFVYMPNHIIIRLYAQTCFMKREKKCISSEIVEHADVYRLIL